MAADWYVELVDEDGNSRRPLAICDLIIPPKIFAVDDSLIWEWPEPLRSWKVVRPGPAMLVDFLGLATASAAQICQYAKKWGVLGLCKHSIPSTHSFSKRLIPHYSPEQSAYDPGDLCAPGLYGGSEPLSSWRHFSGQAAAVLSLAARLHRDLPGEIEDLRTLAEWLPTGREREQWVQHWQKPVGPLSVKNYQSMLVASVVNEWLEMGYVRPVLSWGDRPSRQSKPATVFLEEDTYQFNLFGALAKELMSSVSREQRLGTCSGCRGFYNAAKRAPKVNQRNFCPDCREKRVDQRLAEAAYRKRKQAD